MRLRTVPSHTGIIIEAWNFDDGVHAHDINPVTPTWTGAVGRATMVDLASSCLKLLGHNHLASELKERERTRFKDIEDKVWNDAVSGLNERHAKQLNEGLRRSMK